MGVHLIWRRSPSPRGKGREVLGHGVTMTYPADGKRDCNCRRIGQMIFPFFVIARSEKRRSNLRDFLRDCTVENKQYYVYIMTNKRNTALYTGVTNNLKKRVYGHKNKLVDGFTKRYNIVKLVYCEVFDSAETAIRREKQIKGGSRQKKVDLINSINKEWRDLFEEV